MSGALWTTEPDIPRVALGIPHRKGRLTALGNGQVPLCAATAWRVLMADLGENTMANDDTRAQAWVAQAAAGEGE